ncbi:MAG TPA: DNA cytosine methyltransferase [Gemmataceae bacterium]|nr:DNA cytosine methyltransferase [Gemmataceae bacterium]
MRCVSLFSGCGGLDLGLEQAGFTIVLAVDNWGRAAESYAANRPNTPFYKGSVNDLTLSLMKNVSNRGIAEGVDLLAGGPPCPPYSKSRFYRKNKPRALADKLGQETMAGYLQVLRFLKPRTFLLENVAGMAYKVHRQALELLETTACELGYKTTWRVLNAADYGVPQIRERFFMVGMRDAQLDFPPPTHCQEGSGDRPRWRTAGEAINDLDTEENADDTGHFAGGQYNHFLKQVPPGDNYLFFTKERGHPNPVFGWRKRYWSFLLKLSPNLPSWTIQARRSNNMGPFHWRNRLLRIEEVKRLQTFPDDWHLAGRIEEQWRQVGNAVPPLLAYHLGKALAEQLGRGGSRTRNGTRDEVADLTSKP